MKRKKIKPKRIRVLKRFMDDEWDDDREDVIGQPNEQTEQGK